MKLRIWQGSHRPLPGIARSYAMVKCARRIPAWDVKFSDRATCSKTAAVFTRPFSPTGKLRPLCAQCLENAFDDVARRVSIEDGMDEWIVQETMST